ncbi:MAG: VC0807 family protein [Acidimicrobiia bacterium]
MHSAARPVGDRCGASQSVGSDLHFELPGLRGLARHAFPSVLEGTIVPLAVFMVALHLLGWRGAVIAGLLWSYGNVARRAVTGRRVPGILILGALTITARALVGLVSGSAFVYFLQPTLGTALVGAIFLGSVTVDRPLAQHLAGDFCPIPQHLLENAHVRRFFFQITLLWAFTQLTSAAITLWLLLSQSVERFVVAKSVVSLSLTLGAIVLSALWFRRSMARHGIPVRWRAVVGAS